MNRSSDPAAASLPAPPSVEDGLAQKARVAAQTNVKAQTDQAASRGTGSDDPLIGRVLSGLYRIGERIGEGGMGAVYRAEHVKLRKEFAIKVLVPDAASREMALERLRQEAIAASSIDHRNIVRVVNLDETDDGLLYIVMELLEGQSLADRIEESVLDAEDAIEIALQICSALQATHARGIVHRDLKPDNIFLTTRDGETVVKILDFGISKVKRDDAENVRVTKTGQLVGTPLYMSPEQAKGETDMDHRVDIYALGVLLYEMVAGEPPFSGSNYFQILWKHGNEEPPKPSSHDHARRIPPALEEAILRALAKDPEDRFDSTADFADELRAAKLRVDAQSTKRKSRHWVLVTGVLFAALGLVAWWMSRVDHTSAPAEPSSEKTSLALTPSDSSATEDAPEPKAQGHESMVEEKAHATPTLTFDLRPADAEVEIGNVVLRGPSSFQLREYDPAVDGGAVKLTIRRRGFRSETHWVDPRDSKPVAIELKRLRRRPPNPAPMITEY